MWLLINVQTTLASIQIICTGFPRTGTESLMEALEILGYKTYYTKKLLVESYGGKHFTNWKYLVDTDCQTEDAGQLLKDMIEVDAQATAVSYIGGVICLEKLLELYPHAKVVHTQRINADVWAESIINAPCVMFPKLDWAGNVFTTPKRAHEFFDSFVNKVWMGYPPGTYPPSYDTCRAQRDALKAQYTAHNEKIHERVPPERFLHFAKPEWGPLANFLGTEIPSTKYPHSNSRKQFLRDIILILVALLAVVVMVVFLVITLVLKMRRKPKRD